MNSRRVTPSIGLPPLGWATDTYRMLNLAQSGRQVLGPDLNCSESTRARPACAATPDDSTHDTPGTAALREVAQAHLSIAELSALTKPDK